MVYDPKSRSAVAAPEPQQKKSPATCQEADSRKAEAAEPERARDGSVMFEGVRLTHPTASSIPARNLTKLDVARYYAAIQDWILPELSRRLLTLVRSPAVGMKTFYQKHIGDEAPDGDQALQHRRRRRAGDLSLHRGSAGPRRPGADGRAGNPSLGLAGRQARDCPTG